MRSMRRRPIRLLALLLALTVLLSGCASSPEDPGTTTPDIASAPSETTQSTDGPSSAPSSDTSVSGTASAGASTPDTATPLAEPEPPTEPPKTGQPSGGTAATAPSSGSDSSRPPAHPASTSPASTQPEPEPEEDTVTVHILLPEGDSLVTDETETLKEGDTALGVLLRVCERHSMEADIRGSGGTAYVAAIGDWREREQGALSGWIYKVNGTQVSKSAGAYKLAAGDEIKWVYSLDMGKDAQDR